MMTKLLVVFFFIQMMNMKRKTEIKMANKRYIMYIH